MEHFADFLTELTGRTKNQINALRDFFIHSAILYIIIYGILNKAKLIVSYIKKRKIGQNRLIVAFVVVFSLSLLSKTFLLNYNVGKKFSTVFSYFIFFLGNLESFVSFNNFITFDKINSNNEIPSNAFQYVMF